MSGRQLRRAMVLLAAAAAAAVVLALVVGRSWPDPLLPVVIGAGVSGRRFRLHRPRPEGLLALTLPTAALVALVAFAVLSGTDPSHGELSLFALLALTAAAASWVGARLGLAAAVGAAGAGARVGWLLVAAFGLGVGLLWFGETIAVIVLNWNG
jgi:hypothetical protein